jgi:glycosyltransferase involved in cell wall biosynthesis
MKSVRIAYVNANFRVNHTGGGHVHMGQFVANAVALGHEVWSYADFGISGFRRLPTTRIAHIRAMRTMDVLYVRVESAFAYECSWALPPRRTLYGFPVVVWEFNTVPEHALLRGHSEQDVRKAVDYFRRYGRGCDLAVCVTQSLAQYARDKLGIQRILVVSNGSDPRLFRPDAPVAKRMEPFRGRFNVVWIGSGKEPWHDLEMLKQAAQRLCETDSGKDVIFHLIGPGLAGFMANTPPNVFYWGAERYSRLPQWLSGMDLGLNLYRPGPADYGSPLKVFDYMASGLAVVGTPQPSMENLFGQLGQSDLLVPHADPARLAEVLVSLASDRGRVKRLGQTARQLVLDRYNWRRAVQDTMNEIASILEEKGKVRKV